MNDKAVVEQINESEIQNKYIAYCDILGFSSRIHHDFEGTLAVYQNFGRRLEAHAYASQVRLTMYSDAILLTSNDLGFLLSAVNDVWFTALTGDFMIRGGIAYGKYWEKKSGDNFFVVSDALVEAARLESTVSFPAVVLADNIALDIKYWIPRFQRGTFGTTLLHFRDRNIVNPFNPAWGRSAQHRAQMLMDKSPNHKVKYQWFLALYDAVKSNQDLVPPHIVDELFDKKILIPQDRIPETKD